MAYRPLTPSRGHRSTAAAHDDAYEMNATRSTTPNTLHVADTRYHPLASSENIRSGYHPVVTATDEGYETNATQSATNNAVRVADDSYRPLASSDDIPSGAGSHIGADGHPVTRDSISSAPQQDETTEDHELNSPTLRRSTEKPRRGRALEMFKASYMRTALDSWFYEIAALTFSAGCLVALAVMLGIYNGEETPHLPYNITLNALIAVLSTTARSSLLFAVAGTLGQIKWAWFTESRELTDMQTFDGATRGPWGALVLLCSRSIRPLASLGAVITILSLAYGPFLQQLVRYPEKPKSLFSQEAATKKATSLNATINFSNWDSARVAIWSDISQFDRDAVCPTGNCTWDPFSSLGYCSKCSDTTAETSMDCTPIFGTWDGWSNETCEIYPEQGNPATVWSGSSINGSNSYSTLNSIVWVIRETSGLASGDALRHPIKAPDPQPNASFRSGYSYLGIENPMMVFGHAVFEQRDMVDPPVVEFSLPILTKAETCVITPCERTYQLSMTAGQLDAVVVDTDYGVSEILGWPPVPPVPYDQETIDLFHPGPQTMPAPEMKRCWRTTSYRGADAPPPVEECSSNGPVVNACYGGDATSGYIFCSGEGVFSSAKVTDSIGLLGCEGGTIDIIDPEIRWADDAKKLEEQQRVMKMGYPMEADIGQAIQAHNFSYLMERIAASLTKAELDNSSTLVYGNMTTSVVHVEVVWYWFILPATLNVVAILLLLATAILSHRRKTRLWKSSALALLYHGLDDTEPAPDLTMANVSDMERWASATSATLGLTKDGGRVVLRVLPRGRAPRD